MRAIGENSVFLGGLGNVSKNGTPVACVCDKSASRRRQHTSLLGAGDMVTKVAGTLDGNIGGCVPCSGSRQQVH